MGDGLATRVVDLDKRPRVDANGFLDALLGDTRLTQAEFVVIKFAGPEIGAPVEVDEAHGARVMYELINAEGKTIPLQTPKDQWMYWIHSQEQHSRTDTLKAALLARNPLDLLGRKTVYVDKTPIYSNKPLPQREVCGGLD